MTGEPAHQPTTETTEPAIGRDLVPYDPARFEHDRATVEDGLWAKIRRTAARIPFAEEAAAAYYCAADKRTPIQVRAILMGALAYFVIPTDAIPDFLTGLGFSDDATVFYIAWQTISKHVNEEHRDKARAILARLRGDTKPG